MSINVRAGDKIPLNVVLDDGAADKFVRAFLYDNANNSITGSPVVLSHVGEGFYRNDQVAADVRSQRVFAVYEVFDDAEFNWPSYEYDLRTQDVFEISPDTTKATYQVCVPPRMELPASGSKAYRFVLYLFDDYGVPTDAEDSKVSVHIEDAQNNIVLANVECQREQVGVYFYRYTVTSADVERPVWVEFTFNRSGLPYLVGQVSETIKTDARTVSIDRDKLTESRVTNLAKLDVAVSTRQSADVALSQYNGLGSDIASVGKGVSDVNGKLGSPVGADFSADLVAIYDRTVKIGNPIHGTLSADNANIQDQLSKIGTPATGTLASDLAGIDSHLTLQDKNISAVKQDTQKIGTNDSAVASALGKLSDGEAVTQGKIAALEAKLGAPAHSTVSADLASIQDDVATLRERLTAQRATNLDLLDAPVSSRESEDEASDRYNALFNSVHGVLSAVGAIPNNTTFVGIVPPVLVLPESGKKTYKFFVNLFDQQGLPEDPDDNAMTFRVETASGSTILPLETMFRVSRGQFQGQYEVRADDAEQTLFVVFNYSKNEVTYQQIRITEVQEFESKLDLLLQRVTHTRAQNLDRLDANVSSRQAGSDSLNQYGDLAARIQQTLLQAQAIQAILGMPVVTLASDIASVKSWVASLSSELSQVKVSTEQIGQPASGSLVGEILLVLQRVADLKSSLSDAVASQSTRTVNALSAPLADIRAKLGSGSASIEDTINNLSFGQLLTILGAPAHGSLAQDIRAVDAHLSAQDATLGAISGPVTRLPGIASDVASLRVLTTIPEQLAEIEVKLDHVGSADVSSIEAKVTAIQSGLQVVDAHVQAIPTDTVRATDSRLDNLDAPVSSRATPTNGGTTGSVIVGGAMLDLVGQVDTETDTVTAVFEDDFGELQGVVSNIEE